MAVSVSISKEVRPILDSLAQSPDAVFVTDRNNRILLWNRAAERILGHTATEVTGYACCTLLLGSDHFGNRYCSSPCPVVQMAARNEAVRRFELTVRTKDRGSLAVEVQVITMSAPAPYRFLLSHIIRPLDKAAASPAAAPPPESSVRPETVTDARARKLTHRELEVLGMIANGLSTADIAARLGISALTARNHVQNLLEKLEVHSKSEAVAFAFRHGLLKKEG